MSELFDPYAALHPYGQCELVADPVAVPKLTTRLTSQGVHLTDCNGQDITLGNVGGVFAISYLRPDVGVVNGELITVHELCVGTATVFEYVFESVLAEFPGDILSIEGGGSRNHLNNCDVSDPPFFCEESVDDCCMVNYAGSNPNTPDATVRPGTLTLRDVLGRYWFRTSTAMNFDGPFVSDPVRAILAALGLRHWQTKALEEIEVGPNVRLIEINEAACNGEISAIWQDSEGLAWSSDSALQAALNDFNNGVPHAGAWEVAGGKIKVGTRRKLYSAVVHNTATEVTEEVYFCPLNCLAGEDSLSDCEVTERLICTIRDIANF